MLGQDRSAKWALIVCGPATFVRRMNQMNHKSKSTAHELPERFVLLFLLSFPYLVPAAFSDLLFIHKGTEPSSSISYRLSDLSIYL